MEAIASSLFPESTREEKEAGSDGSGEEGRGPSRELRIEVLERCAKGTPLGCLLPPFLAVMSDHNVRTLDSALKLLQELSPLSRLTAQVSVDGPLAVLSLVAVVLERVCPSGCCGASGCQQPLVTP